MENFFADSELMTDFWQEPMQDTKQTQGGKGLRARAKMLYSPHTGAFTLPLFK